MVIVTGGLKNYSVDMQMFTQVPCQQKCWAIPVHGLQNEEAKWKELPSMQYAGSLDATLISIDNRYVYQIGGSNPHNQNVVRLDLDRLRDGWRVYDLHEKFTKVPRHYMERDQRIIFDIDHPDYNEQVQTAVIEDDKALDDVDKKWWERAAAQKALNKSQMGVFHIPQKISEFKRPKIDVNETSFLVFGGMPFVEQNVQTKAYLLTIRHNTKQAQIAKLPNAELPGEGEIFRGNATLGL